MFKSKKGYMHHPLVWAFIAGLVLAIALTYALNKGMIPGVGFKFC